MIIKRLSILLLLICTHIQVKSELVANWKMNESFWNGAFGEVVDFSDNHIHGTAVNGSNTVSGFVGYCGHFDGVDDYVSIPLDSNLQNFSQKSVFMWIKPASVPEFTRQFLTEFQDRIIYARDYFDNAHQEFINGL